MKLEEIRSIRHETTPQGVNQAISEGYRIIKVFSTKVSGDGYEQVMPMHILAKK